MRNRNTEKYWSHDGYWLEIINVRVAGKSRMKDAWRVCQQMLSSGVTAQSIKVFQGADYETDLGIHIKRRSISRIPERTTLGLHLAFALCDFGIVSHTVWTEQSNVIAIDEHLNP